MSKELKAFEKLDNTLCLNNIANNIEFGIDIGEHIDCNNVVEMAKCLDIVENALKELKAINEANPNEALDELNEIIEYITEDKKVKYKATILFDCEIIKDALLKAQKLKKVCDVVREKVMPLVSIDEGCVWDNELYQSIELTEEESILLSEVK